MTFHSFTAIAATGLALAAILGGCLGYGSGCPEPASGPIYPNEPSLKYDAIVVLDVSEGKGEYWSSVTELLRSTVVDELRRSKRFAEVNERSAPSPERPAFLLTVEIISANRFGYILTSSVTPYVAGEFEIKDHAGILLSRFVKISCGAHGQSSPPEYRIRNLSEQVAQFVVAYVDGERPAQ